MSRQLLSKSSSYIFCMCINLLWSQYAQFSICLVGKPPETCHFILVEIMSFNKAICSRSGYISSIEWTQSLLETYIYQVKLPLIYHSSSPKISNMWRRWENMWQDHIIISDGFLHHTNLMAMAEQYCFRQSLMLPSALPRLFSSSVTMRRSLSRVLMSSAFVAIFCAAFNFASISRACTCK